MPNELKEREQIALVGHKPAKYLHTPSSIGIIKIEMRQCDPLDERMNMTYPVC